MNAYCYKNIPSILNKSSSGGAFLRIAKCFYDKYPNGLVYGVTIDKTDVYYDSANSYEDCFKFQGSKYISANMGTVFFDIKDALLNARGVMFVGTPCIVHALKRFLIINKVDLDNLISIDLICHGTGEKKFWIDYINWLEKKYNSKIIDYSFRYKEYGWSGYPVYIKFENGKQLLDTYDARVFIRGYLKRLTINKKCNQCQFKRLERVGDLTIGDCWGIEEYMPRISTTGGVSLILSNTSKGDILINSIYESLELEEILHEVDEKFVLNSQSNIKVTVNNNQTNSFMDYYYKNGYIKAIRHFDLYRYRGVLRYYLIKISKMLGVYSLLKSIFS